MIAGNLSKEWMFLKDEAGALGICAIGTVSSRCIESKYVDLFKKWLLNGYDAEMNYMRNNREIRFNPASIMDDTTIIISAAFAYGDGAIKNGVWNHIASHARGRDYHKSIKKRMLKLGESIKKRFADVEFRVFTDSAPLMERSIAVMAGVGSIGKSGMLIVENVGPKVLLGELVCSGVAAGENSIVHSIDICKECNLCVDACPTMALNGDGTLDAGRCLSYLSGEFKDGDLPDEKRRMVKIFGCDVCSDVCPHNVNKKSFLEFPATINIAADIDELIKMSDRELQLKLQGTAMHRTGASMIKRNAIAVSKNLKIKR